MKTEQQTRVEELTGNILENVEDALLFLKKHLQLRWEITKDSTRRKEILELPEVALREAVINAVCHRDYFEQGAQVMVEIFDDRVDIYNPGGLPKGLPVKIDYTTMFSLVFPRPSYITAQDMGKIREIILELIRKTPDITMVKLAEKTDLKPKSIEWQIAQLKKRGLLERTGPARGGHWKIKDDKGK